MCLGYILCSFAIPGPALDSSIPSLFEVGERVSVEFIVEGTEVRENCDGSCWRRRPFLKVEVTGRAEE